MRRRLTPATHAGLVARRLTFRDVFTAVVGFFLFVAVLLRVRWRRRDFGLRLAAAEEQSLAEAPAGSLHQE